MPEGFKFPNDADLWMPLDQMPRLVEQKRDSRSIDVFGRLANGVTIAQAQSEMDTIARKLAARLSRHQQGHRRAGHDVQRADERRPDQAGLPVADGRGRLRAADRLRQRRQPAARALGRPRARDVRPHLARRVALAHRPPAAGRERDAVDHQRAARPGLANVGVRLFDAATQDVGKPYWIQFTMDAQVFAFFAAVCLGTGIVFGLAPALHVSKTDLNEVLKEGGRSGSSGMRARRWTSALIVVELALTLVLLAGAGLMMRSFLNLYRLDVGVETSHLLTMRLTLPEPEIPDAGAAQDLLRAARPAAGGSRRRRSRHDHDQPAARRRLPAPAVDGRQGNPEASSRRRSRR